MGQAAQGSVHGSGYGQEGRRLTVYRAKRRLTCAGCARGIEVGDLFTRGGTTRGVRTRPFPHCESCRPVSRIYVGAGGRGG